MTPNDAANGDKPRTDPGQPTGIGSPFFREPQPPGNAALLEEQTPLPEEEADSLAEQQRHDLPAGETIGDAEGSGAGIDIGSGTEEPKPIGGGKPPESAESVEPSGSYKPGQSRD